jgi:hypothetical protein
VSVFAYFSVLAHAQRSGLNGLDPNRTGRIADAPRLAIGEARVGNDP